MAGNAGLIETTVRQRCSNSKSVFTEAVERELIETNPFRKVKSASVAAKRVRYVAPDEVETPEQRAQVWTTMTATEGQAL